MTHPDIEATLYATYSRLHVEGVCAVLILGSLTVIFQLMRRLAA